MTRNSLIDYLSRELLEAAIELKLKYKEIKAKLIKNTVNNALPGYKKWVIKKKGNRTSVHEEKSVTA